MVGGEYHNIGVYINGGTPIAGWFVVENTIKMDLGVPLFQETFR